MFLSKHQPATHVLPALDEKYMQCLSHWLNNSHTCAEAGGDMHIDLTDNQSTTEHGAKRAQENQSCLKDSRPPLRP